MTEKSEYGSVLTWLKKWTWELIGLIAVGIAIGTNKGLNVGLHAVAALFVIAVNIDVISALLGVVSKKFKVNNKGLFFEAAFLTIYYIFLVSNQLTGIIYITVAPSLMLGVLLYFWKVK